VAAPTLTVDFSNFNALVSVARRPGYSLFFPQRHSMNPFDANGEK
jgi:hypothetical protein